MTPGEWENALELFQRMVDSGTPEDVCASEPDESIRREALRLFQHHHRAAPHFLASPVEAILGRFGSPQFAPGHLLLGRFRIIRLAGSGGMGEVYEAFDQLLSESVAIKTILSTARWNPTLSALFFQEVQAARCVTHPNVCRIHDCFLSDGVPFLSMEFIAGDSLAALLSQSAPSLSSSTRLILATQVAAAIAAIHDRSLVHGDLKPGNVLVQTLPAAAPRAVITDFGLAAFLNSAESPHSFLAGTDGYIAPELRSGSSPSIASDLFAFGRILSQLLPGEPFAALCLKDDPAARPSSIRRWRHLDSSAQSRRRALLWSAGAAISVAASFTFFTQRQRPRPLARRERSILNLLHGDPGRQLYPYIEYSLRQSPLIGLLPNPSSTPLDLPSLLTAAKERNARLVFDGAAEILQNSLSVRLAAFSVPNGVQLTSIQFQRPSPYSLAELAALAVRQLRLDLGEQENVISNSNLFATASLNSNAVAFYFEGLQRYEAGEPADALRLFEEALHLDPNFALAYFGASRALSNLSREPEALQACSRALALHSSTTRPQQLAIESLHAVLSNRLDDAISLYRRLHLIEPEQAPWLRQLANVLGLAGRLPEALSAAVQARDIDPLSQLSWSALALLQFEAQRPADALETVRLSRSRGADHPSLLWGEAMALAAANKIPLAIERLSAMAASGPFERLARFQATALQIWSGNLRQASVELETDLFRDLSESHSRWAWERRLRLAQVAADLGDSSRAALWLNELPPPPAAPLYTPLFRHTAVLANQLHCSGLAARLESHIQSICKAWPSPTTEASLCHVRASRLLSSSALQAARAELARGFGLLPDPAMRLTFGRVLRATGEHAAAVDVLAGIDRFTHSILLRDYPGILPHAWLELAQVSEDRNLPSGALSFYNRLVVQWPPLTSGARISQTARQSIINLKNRSQL